MEQKPDTLTPALERAQTATKAAGDYIDQVLVRLFSPRGRPQAERHLDRQQVADLLAEAYVAGVKYGLAAARGMVQR